MIIEVDHSVCRFCHQGEEAGDGKQLYGGVCACRNNANQYLHLECLKTVVSTNGGHRRCDTCRQHYNAKIKRHLKENWSLFNVPGTPLQHYVLVVFFTLLVIGGVAIIVDQLLESVSAHNELVYALAHPTYPPKTTTEKGVVLTKPPRKKRTTKLRKPRNRTTTAMLMTTATTATNATETTTIPETTAARSILMTRPPTTPSTTPAPILLTAGESAAMFFNSTDAIICFVLGAIILVAIFIGAWFTKPVVEQWWVNFLMRNASFSVTEMDLKKVYKVSFEKDRKDRNTATKAAIVHQPMEPSKIKVVPLRKVIPRESVKLPVKKDKVEEAATMLAKPLPDIRFIEPRKPSKDPCTSRQSKSKPEESTVVVDLSTLQSAQWAKAPLLAPPPRTPSIDPCNTHRK